MVIISGAGTVPSNFTVAVTVPAVAGSTAGRPAQGRRGVELPPQASENARSPTEAAKPEQTHRIHYVPWRRGCDSAGVPDRIRGS